MKYLIVLGDGMADKNIPELDNRTPLDYADTPAMDKYSKLSEIGMVRTVPEGMAPGSDTANLSVLGYNPREYYTGRSPLEALSIGVDMKPTDVALRCKYRYGIQQTTFHMKKKRLLTTAPAKSQQKMRLYYWKRSVKN